MNGPFKTPFLQPPRQAPVVLLGILAHLAWWSLYTADRRAFVTKERPRG